MVEYRADAFLVDECRVRMEQPDLDTPSKADDLTLIAYRPGKSGSTASPTGCGNSEYNKATKSRYYLPMVIACWKRFLLYPSLERCYRR